MIKFYKSTILLPASNLKISPPRVFPLNSFNFLRYTYLHRGVIYVVWFFVGVSPSFPARISSLAHRLCPRERDAQRRNQRVGERERPGWIDADRRGGCTHKAPLALSDLSQSDQRCSRSSISVCVCEHGASVAVSPNKPHSHNAGASLIRPAAAGDNSPTASHHAAGNWFSTPDDRERKRDTLTAAETKSIRPFSFLLGWTKSKNTIVFLAYRFNFFIKPARKCFVYYMDWRTNFSFFLLLNPGLL